MLKKALLFFFIFVMCGACSTHDENNNTIEKIEIEKGYVKDAYDLELRVVKPKNLPLNGKKVSWSSEDSIVIIQKDKDSIHKCSVRFLSDGEATIVAEVDGVKDSITLKTRSNNSWVFILFLIVVLSCSVYINIGFIKNRQIKNKSSLKKKLNLDDIKALEKEDKSTDAVDYENKYKKLLPRYKELKEKHIKLVTDYNKLVTDYNKLCDINDNQEDNIAKLEKQIANLKKLQETKVEKQIVQTTRPTANTTEKTGKVLYGDFIIDGAFNRVTDKPNEDTVFELHVNNNTADILIYENAKKRIIANPAYLDGCEIQIIGNSDVIVDEKGRAQLQMDGRWLVINVLKVIIK